jgi:xanthine dehydrogenase accessory factor
MSPTWKLIQASLEKNIPVMLLYVLESTGSSPGRKGFCMAVNFNNEMEGSIGGGMMEYKLVEMSRHLLEKDNSPPVIKKQVHDAMASKDRSGMICSGEQTVLLYRVNITDLDAVKRLIDTLEQDHQGTLLLSEKGIEFLSDTMLPLGFFNKPDNNWQYRESLGGKNNLYIIGGGHCSLALSDLMRGLGFHIEVYDDRQDLNTMQQNNSAHRKHVVPDYSKLKALIPAGDNNYVVIMTLGYRTDDIALRALIEKEFRFIGLLGSAAKINRMMETYKEEGIDEKWLSRIAAPVGLSIKSETPAEIAVSIAAQIIQVKNALPKISGSGNR